MTDADLKTRRFSSRLTIRRLLEQERSVPGTSPAVQCAVVITGMNQPLYGALSETPEGGLRMLSPHSAGLLMEQFFDYDSVIVVAVQRAVTADGSRIVSS